MSANLSVSFLSDRIFHSLYNIVTYPRQGTFIVIKSALEREEDNQRNCKSEASQFLLLAKYWKIKRKEMQNTPGNS